MTSNNADSARSVTRYTGQNYRFTPTFIRSRDPTTLDLKDPANQGYYPITSLWTNKINQNLWALVGIVSNVAKWVMLSTGTTGPVTILQGDDGVSVVPTAGGVITLNGLVVANGTHAKAVFTESPSSSTEKIDIQVAAAVASTDVTKVGLSAFSSSQFAVDANGFTTIKGGTGPALLTMSDDVSASISPSGTGNIQLVGHVVEQGSTKFSTVVAGTNLANINPMSSYRWIIDPLGFNGTHTTLTTAMASATSGDTIKIIAGSTLTENVTIKPGVNIVGDSGDDLTPNVTIIGTITMTGAGTSSISGVRLQTNSANIISITGSAASILNVRNAFLNCTNNSGINFSSSSSSAALNIYFCTGSLGTTGIAFYTSTSAGNININYSVITNPGASVIASSNSSGASSINYCNIAFPLTTSSTGTLNLFQCLVSTTALNTTSVTTAGTGSSMAQFCNFGAGSASAVSVGTGTTLALTTCNITSSNTNAITGAGTLQYSTISFGNGSSSLINTTTQSGGVINGGRFQAPSAGFIGEQIRATVGGGSPVSLTNNTPTNITSISLTAGIWDVSGLIIIQGVTTGTSLKGSVVTTTATDGTQGDNLASWPFSGSGNQSPSLVIPAYRLTLTATTTVFLTANVAFTVGTGVAYGRISGTRVG